MEIRGPYPNELYHYGVKNQKWGIRRWQNEDGTLTAAGREHYGIGSGNANKEARGYKRALNQMEIARAKDVAEDIRYTERANRARNEYGEKSNRETAKSYKDSIKAQDAATKKLLDEIKKKGYNVTSKDTVRAINDGTEYIAGFLGGALGTAVYLTGREAYNKARYGTKYSAKVNGKTVDQTPNQVASKKYKVTRD